MTGAFLRVSHVLARVLARVLWTWRQVEMLLESYLQEVGATVAELEVLTYGIEGTEKFVSFRLDSARNRLLKVDVIATASATALGIGQLVSGARAACAAWCRPHCREWPPARAARHRCAGIFGMNLPTSLFRPEVTGEDTTFVVVAGATVSLVLVLIFFLVIFFYTNIWGYVRRPTARPMLDLPCRTSPSPTTPAASIAPQPQRLTTCLLMECVLPARAPLSDGSCFACAAPTTPRLLTSS